MKRLRIIYLFSLAVLTFLLSTCTKQSDPWPEPQPSPQPETFHGVRIYILSVGDLHEYSGNLAQFATLVKQVRDTATNVYTVLAGDFFMAHGNYNVQRCSGQTDMKVPPDLKVPKDSSQYFAGEAMARMVDFLDFSAIAPGNHDWVYGQRLLNKRGIKAKLIGCNVGEPADFVKEYITFHSTQGKYTLNLIGVAGNDNIHSFAGESVRVYSITTSTSQSKLRAAINSGDINVLVTHLTDADDLSAFSTLRGNRGTILFDALCGGHTHKSEALLKSGSVYVKAGLFDTYAGVTCIWWDTVRRTVVKRTTRLDCLEGLSKDPATAALIDSLHRVYPHYQ